MKSVVLALLTCAVAAAPAWADQHYANPRFGYAIMVPAALGFGRLDSENGDGAAFYAKDHSVELSVWGHWQAQPGFAAAADQAVKFHRKAGWTVSYAAGAGKNFEVFSGTKGDRIVYQRVIPTCGGSAAAHYRLEYPAASKAAYDSVIQALNASLAEAKGSCAP